jgi:lysophospholipase L1-like esterase
MGDSFVEGNYTPYGQSLLGFLERAASASTRVKNYGVSSYSPILYLLQWQETVKHFEPTHVFLLLYSNDISDDRRYASLATLLPNGEIKGIPGSDGNWLIRALRHLYVARLIRKAQNHLQWILADLNPKGSQRVIGGYIEEKPPLAGPTEERVLALATLVRQSGAKFSLMSVPSKYDLNTGDQATIEERPSSDVWRPWAHSHGLDYIDLTPSFQTASAEGIRSFYETDIHFNAHGNRIAAEAIERAFPQVFAKALE